MNILVVGANGQIGRHLVEKLGKSEHKVKAMIRDQAQAEEMEKRGADDVVIADLEGDFAHAMEGCQAVIFTAGSGAHTGPDKTELVDRQGAIHTIEQAEKQGIERFIMVSAMNTDDPENGPERIHHYLRAKAAADERLQASQLNYTIVRPGRLTNDPGSGKVSAARHLEYTSRNIPREDVSSTVCACFEESNTERRIFELLSGDQDIHEALKSL